jgi:hypothetical protein
MIYKLKNHDLFYSDGIFQKEEKRIVMEQVEREE